MTTSQQQHSREMAIADGIVAENDLTRAMIVKGAAKGNCRRHKRVGAHGHACGRCDGEPTLTAFVVGHVIMHDCDLLNPCVAAKLCCEDPEDIDARSRQPQRQVCQCNHVKWNGDVLGHVPI